MGQQVDSYEIIDSQIHVWEPNSKARPWDEAFAQSRASFIKFADPNTIERALGAMDAVGVRKALVTSFHLYHDIGYAREAVERYPLRFALVPHVELTEPNPEDLMSGYSAEPGIVALRISLMGKGDENFERLYQGKYKRLLDSIASTGLPLMVLAAGHVKAIAWIAEHYPQTQLIVDHFGMIQGPNRQPPEDRFSGLEDLLSLAAFPSIAIKVTGLPTLSREGFPFRDLWPALRTAIDRFGAERLMWGSDFSRTRPMHTYADAINYLKYSDALSESERRWILSSTAQKLIGWHRKPLPSP